MAILLALGGAVAIVWTTALLRLGTLLAACLTTLVLGVVLGYDFFHVSVVTTDRLLLAATVGGCLVQLRCGWLPRPRLNKADLWLLLLLGYLAASTFMHDWRADQAAPAAHLVFFYLLPAAIYAVARCQPISQKQLTAVLVVLTCLGCYLGATAIAEVKGWWPLVFPPYVRSPRIQEFFGRGRGPLLNPVGNGLWMSAALASALVLSIRAGKGARLWLAGIAAVILVGCYATLTRTAWMGAGAVVLTFLWLRLPLRLRLPVFASLVLLVAVVVAASWPHLMAFKRDKFVSAHDMAESAELRPILATIAWKMFLERPLVGFGFGQYPRTHINFINERTFDLPLAKARPYIQHNVFLAHLVDGGLIGALLFCLLWFQWSLDAWKLAHRGRPSGVARRLGILLACALAAYLPNSLFHELNVIPMTNMLFFFLAGLAEAQLSADEHEGRGADDGEVGVPASAGTH